MDGADAPTPSIGRPASAGRDVLGRVTSLTEYFESGAVAYNKVSTYNGKSEVTSETSLVTQDDGDRTRTVSTYYYDSNRDGNGVYQGGGVTRIVNAVDEIEVDGSINDKSDTRTDYSYAWWGNALQSSIDHDSDTGDTNNVIWNSSYTYDAAGMLTKAHIVGTGNDADARTRDLVFVNDANGLILQRDETDYTSSTAGNPRELHYYMNGIRVGDISNDGTSNTDYAASVNARNDGGYGAFRGGANAATPYADFDQSYDAINGLSYDATAARYTVQTGDTLSSIALQLWGDASYWYMIAEANGLTGTETLAAGRTLLIPGKVHNSHNSADVYRVYDPNTAIGDTMPSAVKPPKANKGCGTFGQILMVAIAVAVAVVTTGAGLALANGASLASGLATIGIGSGAAISGVTAGGFIAAGAVGGAIGSIASQGFGIATGIQNGFSWKGVALSALAGGISGGIGASGLLNGASPFLQGAARGIASGALTQGLALATGLQSKFDWAGVAAAGVGGGVGAWAGSSLGLSGFGAKVVPGMAGGIAGAAATSLVTGRDFGDTLMSQLPSIIGNTVGNLVAEGIASRDAPGWQKAGILTPAQQAMMNEPLVMPGGTQNNPSLMDGIGATTGGNSAGIVAAAGQAQKQQSEQGGRGTVMVAPSGDYINPRISPPASYSQLDEQDAYFDGINAEYRASHNGADYADYAEIKANIAYWRNEGLAKANAVADRAVWDVVVATNPLSVPTAAWRFTHGEANVANGVEVGAAVLPLLKPVAKPVGKLIGKSLAGTGRVIAAESEVLNGANFAQKTFKSTFSAEGKFAGRPVSDVAADLNAGRLSPTDVPIEYIVRDGNTLILNTRSAQALEQAGIPRGQWNAVNMTGSAQAEARLTGQLSRNRLTNQGTATVRPSNGN